MDQGLQDDVPHKVLFITELLEGILLQADVRTLLTAQRVCRKWQAVIRKSSALQIQLFMKPSPEQPRSGERRETNPLLLHLWIRLWSGPARKTILKSLGENVADDTILGKLSPDPHAVDAFCRPDASWRRMFVQQPPTKRLSIVHGVYRLRRQPLEKWIDGGKDFIRLELLISMMAKLDICDFDRSCVRTCSVSTRSGRVWGFKLSVPGESNDLMMVSDSKVIDAEPWPWYRNLICAP
ncbi:hypothetical protein BDW71DRAFT_188305 [Aspergillus fruticulosus]